jgi:uncharacterized membrane protein YgdD (TMEM256/DUF423 family)
LPLSKIVVTNPTANSEQTTTAIAALLAAIAVAFGAYAAHGLAGRIESLGFADTLELRVAWFETGARYQMFHALGALASIALSAKTIAPNAARLASYAFFLGILLFCGSLYVMTFATPEWKKLGAITPLGGLAFIVGWLILAIGAIRHKPSD